MTVGLDAKTLTYAVDRVLESGVVEGDQAPALLADQMMVMVAAGMDGLKQRLTGSHGHSLRQSVLDQQLEHSVDAGPPAGASLGAKRILDLHRAEGAGLLAEQPNDPIAGASALEPGAGQHLVGMLLPAQSRFAGTVN